MAVELFQEFRPQMAIPNAYVGDNLEKPLLCTVCYASFSGPSELRGSMGSRDRPRFFDEVGHQTTNASI